MNQDKIRMIAILVISLAVIITGSLFSFKAFQNGEIIGGILGLIIALTILWFAYIVYSRGNKDLKKGLPIKDERSQRVMERAMSKAFLVSLYVLLGIGFISDKIPFRDISQVTGVTVGIMALLFAGFWMYYNGREV